MMYDVKLTHKCHNLSVATSPYTAKAAYNSHPVYSEIETLFECIPIHYYDTYVPF